MLRPDRHVEDMDRLGIAVELISTSTVVGGTSWADPATDLALCRRVNDAAAEWVSRYPKRMVGSCVLPLQDLDRALGELERAVEELGLRVVNAPAQVQGRYLGHSSLWPFWEAVAASDLVVFIHPEGVRDPWFQEYSLWNSVGQPIEETKCLASLIYEGLLERFPSLKIVVSHGGGYLPHYFGRLDRNVHNMPASTVNITRRPSEYLDLVYYDTCLYEPMVLDALVRRFGAERLVMGSDYPVGESDPLGFVDRCELLTEAERDQVKGGNAARLLGLG
jgi:aminocarboxymuconate-semialdehyde decarboxylase